MVKKGNWRINKKARENVAAFNCMQILTPVCQNIKALQLFYLNEGLFEEKFSGDWEVKSFSYCSECFTAHYYCWEPCSRCIRQKTIKSSIRPKPKQKPSSSSRPKKANFRYDYTVPRVVTYEGGDKEVVF